MVRMVFMVRSERRALMQRIVRNTVGITKQIGLNIEKRINCLSMCFTVRQKLCACIN